MSEVTESTPYIRWLDSLTYPQTRALACQCGFTDWETAKVTDLFARLIETEAALPIFERTYGQETSVQG